MRELPPRQNTPGCSIFSKGWICVLPPSLSCFFYLFCLWVLKHTTNGPTAQSLITHCWTLHSHWGQCKRQEDTYMHIAQHEKMPRNPKMLSSGLWSWCNDHASYIEDTKSHCNKIVTRDGFIALALALALALYKFIWSPLREFRLYKYKLLAWCPSLNLQQVYSAHHRTKLGGCALFYMSGQMAEWCVAVFECVQMTLASAGLVSGKTKCSMVEAEEVHAHINPCIQPRRPWHVIIIITNSPATSGH